MTSNLTSIDNKIHQVGKPFVLPIHIQVLSFEYEQVAPANSV